MQSPMLRCPATKLELAEKTQAVNCGGLAFVQRGREVSLLNLQYLGEELIVPSGALPLSFQTVCGGMVL
jgi:hypothetical protein